MAKEKIKPTKQRKDDFVLRDLIRIQECDLIRLIENEFFAEYCDCPETRHGVIIGSYDFGEDYFAYDTPGCTHMVQFDTGYPSEFREDFEIELNDDGTYTVIWDKNAIVYHEE